MLSFPNAKINIGLNITEKRQDGFHNIETIFYPIGLGDVLEVLPNENSRAPYTFENTGLQIDAQPEDNLCIKAYKLLQKDFDLPPIKIALHKIIPFGAGLGGGSADASFMLKALNSIFDLDLSVSKLEDYAKQLGSDCAFFIENKPVFAYQKGDVFKDVELSLQNYQIVIIRPDIHVPTKDAYAGVIPKQSQISLLELIKQPVENWKNQIVNDFEKSIFPKYPKIKEIKENLYNTGAVYASMSGSGSAVYGIFNKPQEIRNILDKYTHHFIWHS